LENFRSCPSWLNPRGLRHLIECLDLGLAKGNGQFFGKDTLAAFKVFAVGCAQGVILLEHPEVFVYFGAGTWITFFHHGLVGVGPGFPLIADLGFPVFHVVQKIFCQRETHRGADDVVETVFTNQQRDAFTPEKDFCKSGIVFARKASAADGLHLADTVVGMIDTIALGYGDKFSPLGDDLDAGKKYLINILLHYFYHNSKPFLRLFWALGDCRGPGIRAQPITGLAGTTGFRQTDGIRKIAVPM